MRIIYKQNFSMSFQIVDTFTLTTSDLIQTSLTPLTLGVVQILYDLYAKNGYSPKAALLDAGLMSASMIGVRLLTKKVIE